MSTKDVTCRYFLHGVCRQGNLCLFSHDLSSSKPSTVCRFYQRGVCAYGGRCRYDHVKPSGRVEAGGGATGEELAVGMATAMGGGASAQAGARKALVLKDRVLGVDSVCSDVSSGLMSEVPPHSYVDAIRSGLDSSQEAAVSVGGAYHHVPQLCPYAAVGHCHYEEKCLYLHGDQCDVCGLQVLHPHDLEQRSLHNKMCLLAFEADMDRAFAAQLSQDKVCSICMEVVVQKANPSDRRFGILSSCCHIFCLACIRKWRCTKQFSNKIIKSCPECRVVSEFVIPSVSWVEDQDEKNRLIELFKCGVSKKSCKYFAQGRGSCPFADRCLYLHAFPDGSRAAPEPTRKQLSSEGNVRFMNSVRLWDYIEEREQRAVPTVPPFDDDITELRELFVQMSGPSQEGPESTAPADQ
ncbi:E3 ubiquitin-protein ligase makorin-2 [Genypterus blacodes]|uniref:E3 ubiquitin-protein ligase makorin-2 n=1 Tax=Genypterus blacodes TaxID=154954 RepID=UPI003F773806